MPKKKNYILTSEHKEYEQYEQINNLDILKNNSMLIDTLGKTDKKIFEKFNEYEFDDDSIINFNKINKNDKQINILYSNAHKKISDVLILNDEIETDIDVDIVSNTIVDANQNPNPIPDADILNVNKFNNKEKMLFEELNEFYNNCDIKEIELIIEIIDGNHKVSLRFLDWFVTRYCYLYKLSINVNNSHIKNQEVNIHISYDAQLKSVGKRKFDPFRRNKKFLYNFGCHNICKLTTLGQLNFFKWLLNYGIITYVYENYDTINEKLNHVNSHFKKHIKDSNSFSITTSDENSDTMTKSSLSSVSELSQSDISFLMGTDVKNNSIKIIKQSKKFNDLKNSQKISKYPQVTRNICIEF